MARAPVRSPCEAAAAQRGNWSVTLAMALTTTTGCLPMDTRPATMEAVRLIAAEFHDYETHARITTISTRTLRGAPSSRNAGPSTAAAAAASAQGDSPERAATRGLRFRRQVQAFPGWPAAPR